jgi:putative redox protein
VHAVYVFDFGAEDDESVQMWGLVTDLDLVAACPVIDERTAGSSAVTPLVTVLRDEPLDRAAQLMAKTSTSHLAVLDPATGRPVGVLSTLDIARVLAAGRGIREMQPLPERTLCRCPGSLNAPPSKPDRGGNDMGLTATARSSPGTLRQEVVIDGRHRLWTDEPAQLGGEDTGPAPHELFPAALAACVSTTLLIYARTKQWDLGEVTVDVDYEHRSIPRRFMIHVALTGELTAGQLDRLEKVAAACPLRRSIESGIEFDELIELRRPSAVPATCGRS